MTHAEPPRTVGFGVPDSIDPHHFVVRIPTGNAGDIEIIEKFGVNSQSDDVDELLRCRLPRPAWTGIREEAKRILNERLREKKLKPSRWMPGENKVERLLGRELCLLAWAVEAAQPAQYDAACVSWAALKPEERWWLFRMCDNATGAAADIDRGWRKAVRIGLTETPGPASRTSSRSTAAKRNETVDLFSSLGKN